MHNALLALHIAYVPLMKNAASFFPERRLHNGCSLSWGFDTAVCPFRWNSNSFYVQRVTFGTV